MQVTYTHNNDVILPEGYRWVKSLEIREEGDLYEFNGQWEAIDTFIGRKQFGNHELIRKISNENNSSKV